MGGSEPPSDEPERWAGGEGDPESARSEGVSKNCCSKTKTVSSIKSSTFATSGMEWMCGSVFEGIILVCCAAA